MTWLWVILIVGVVVGIVVYLATGNSNDAVETGLGAAFGCGSIIFQIFIGVLGLAVMIWLFGWLFGGCS